MAEKRAPPALRRPSGLNRAVTGAGEHVVVSHLVEHFAKAVGPERARELVETAARVRGHTAPILARSEAVEVLDVLATGDEAVASTARFVKARLLLGG